MKSTAELLQYGKEISESYVRDNTPLTQSLEKTAQVHGLNKQEMYRVAETANVETYLKVINRAEDKYVEFPLANVEEAYSNIMSKTASADKISEDDYADIQPRREFSFSLYKAAAAEDLTKVAETAVNKAELFAKADHLNGTLAYLDNELMGEAVKLAKTYDTIYNTAKQILLGGENNFADIAEVVKSAGYAHSEGLLQNLEEDLKNIMQTYDFTKKATYSGAVNTDSELYREVADYVNQFSYIDKIAQALKTYEEQFDELNNTFKLGIAKKAGLEKSPSIIKKGIKILGGAAGLTLGAAVAGAGIGAKIGKDQVAAGQILNRYNAGSEMMQARQLLR